MANWIGKYKEMVMASHRQHLIIADTDQLFKYDELAAAFRSEGYKVFQCPTGLMVRITFELQVRRSADKCLIVAPANYHPLPDMEMHAHFERIGLGHIFPNYDSKAIAGLSFNALALLSNIRSYEQLGYEKTLKFLLENLYNVDFDTLKTSKPRERIMNALINVIVEKNGINEALNKFLSNLAKPYFPELAIEYLSKDKLINYLAREWKKYLTQETAALDFEESLLWKSIGFLFVTGQLKPLQVTEERFSILPQPLHVGAWVDQQGALEQEVESMIAYLQQEVLTIENLPEQWFKLMQVMASLRMKLFSSGREELQLAYKALETSINERFQLFLDSNYTSLFSLSGVRRPVVVSRILEHINAQSFQRKALVVIDGMNYWQWALIEESLAESGLEIKTGASLAWIPSITAWSRQAIFRGDKPDLAATNSREEQLFKTFWTRNGVSDYEIAFARFGIHEEFDSQSIADHIKVFGMVCNDLDDIMHGSVMGNEQLKNSTQQWIKESAICQILTSLSAMGFQIFITSDHGNVEAQGIKNLNHKDKVGSISRGKRHLQFTNETLQQSFIENNSAVSIGRRGLSVYLKNEEAFTDESSRVVTHGGSHLWEVIVPFIQVHAKQA